MTADRPPPSVVCLDVGSTWTKGLLVHTDGGVGAFAQHPTTAGDVLEGMDAVTRAVTAGHRGEEPEPAVLACSSAGGVLRLAVVGVERLVGEEAGHRVARSAGAAVVHVHAGPMSPADVRMLRSFRPGAVLLVGGFGAAGGDVLVHNAGRLARARVRFPIVLAAAAPAAEDALALLRAAGRTVVICDDVLPAAGRIVPEPARAAVAELFSRTVLGGRGAPSAARFRRLVRTTTPVAMGRAASELARVDGNGAAVVVDIGCAATGVYSFGAEGGRWTVEGDLGIRTTAPGLLVAAQADGVVDPVEADLLGPTIARLAEQVRFLPADAGGAAEDRRLGAVAAVIALRRHLRAAPNMRPVQLLVLTGGLFRQRDSEGLGAVRSTVLSDPGLSAALAPATVRMDSGFTLVGAGLLAGEGNEPAAEALLREQLLDA